MIEVLLILVAIALVVAAGAFVAAEFAFVTVDRATVERAADGGDAGAEGVLHALRTLSTQLSAAQVGITVTNLLIGYLAEPSIAKLIDGPLESVGLSEDAAHGVAVVIALVLATAATMVFGELVPKNLAIAKPLATARAVQRFQRAFTVFTRPVVVFLNGTANKVLHRFGLEAQEELASARSPEELVSLVGRSADQGTLAPDTASLVQRSIEFGDRRAVDVMTPRATMHAIQVDADLLSVLREARRTGRSRFPVIPGDNDTVVGIVHIKHALGVPLERRGSTPVSEVMVDPVLVPATMELDALLETLRGSGLHIAVVVDEFGTLAGLVTVEDLIEEIVGEVRDEHDPRDDSVRREGPDTWSLSGLLRPDEASRHVGVLVPDGDDYETLGGLMTELLNRMAESGDRAELEVEDAEGRPYRIALTVTRMDGLRVDRLRLVREALPYETEDER